MTAVADLPQLIRRNHGTWRGWVRHALGLADLQLGRLRAFQAADVAAARRLVFVCLGNINRSAFAGGVARALGAPVASLGLATTTGAPATPQACAAAAARGCDLLPHRATDLADHERRDGDLYVVMEVRHAHRLVAAGIAPRQIVFLGLWGAPARVHLHDPHTLSDEYFATCFALIDTAVRALVAAHRAGGRA